MVNQKQNIAFLGIGLMGSRMAKRLVDAGYCVTVWNRSPAKADPLVEAGAIRAFTPAEAAQQADIIITMLGDHHAVSDVLFGDEGVVAGGAKGALVIDMSSIHPDHSREHQSKLAENGMAYIDAPVSGGVGGAEEGTLAIMAGGAASDIARATPVFDVMGTVFHLGDTGAGQICKLVNQAIVHVTIGAVSEGLLLASALGVDAGKVREAIGGGYCESRILQVHGAKMVHRDFVAGGQTKSGVKDLDGVLNIAGSVGLDLPLTTRVTELYHGLMETGRGDYDHSALLIALEEMNSPHRVAPDKQDILPREHEASSKE